MKKFLSILLVAIMLVGMIGCNGGEESKVETSKTETSKTETSKAEDSKPAEDVLVQTSALYEISKDRTPDRPSLVDDKLKEEFGLEIEWVDIQQSAWSDVINTMMASEEYPEIFWNTNHETDIKNFGMEGYLIALNDLVDTLPNYKALWTEEEFQTVLAFCAAADGNLYYTPTQNYRSASMSWIYRKSAFEANGWEVPTTVDDLYELLKEIKAANPDSIIMPCRGGWKNVTNGMRVAHGVSDKRSYVDAWTGEFIPYGYTQDGWRKALEWNAIFYKEGFIDPEFVTGTDTEWTEQYATGQAFIEYQYCERDVWAEANMSPVDPDVDWAYTTFNITAKEDGTYVYERENNFFSYGYSVTDKASEEVIEKIAAWWDWISTDEGATFFCMGEEGVTYEKNADGTLQFMSHMYHSSRNPEGEQPWKYGMYMGILRQTEDYSREVGKDANVYLSQGFNADSNAKFAAPYAAKYTADEQTRLATLDTQIDDVVGEYSLKFITGELDATDDNEWNAYLAALDAAGLAEASQIRTNGYNNGAK